MATITNFEWRNRPVLGRTAGTNPSNPAQTTTPQEIFLGGFSGLFFEGRTPQGNLRFVTHPDRGPNGEPTDLLRDVAGNERPFALPNFQAEVIRFELNPTTGAFTILNRIPLTRQDGRTPITGLPNLQAGAQGSPYTDEVPIDLWGNRLNNDPLGADLEGIVVARDGTFWLVDEYRPAIYQFSATGTLIDRFVPQGTAAAVNAAPGTFGTEALPAVYAQRRANRGFEAVALEGNKLYAFIQSAIDNPSAANNNTSRNSRNLRIVEFDIVSKRVTGEYIYVLDSIAASGNARTDKIGDAVSLGNGKFVVVERDDLDTTASNKLVYQIDISQATNINNPANLTRLPANTTIEQATYAQLDSAGIQPVSKRLLFNAAQIGYVGVDKLEGLALVDSRTLALLNDNDFGLEPVQIRGNGTVPLDPTPTPVLLGLVRLDRDLPFPEEFTGTAGNDTIQALGGNNRILGLGGNDLIFGNMGNDTIDGGDGNDTLYGGRDRDSVLGGAGNDLLLGDRDNDTVNGGDGNDTLIGVSLTSDNFGTGEIDTLIGGSGSDTFVLANATRTFYLGQRLGDYALIQDFDPATDFLQLRRADTYVTGSAPSGLPSGTAVFLDNDGTPGLSANDDLLAVLVGVATTVNLSSRFTLV
ncbi:MAG: esterase-like activity of phytase family protein [Pseudanabaenaceae cyanobacterium SKYGB_i_bin29]|nr:esterase-like activity of phytase family protein [Pseudanabaenaceae cyanobacterium SKYG29]MDW8420359.1 esterase-like activity of phytase family protein [Pseudanabaenaceae cyanobacterium SKYGB_i_bin29]